MFSCELKARLIKMVGVEMKIAEAVNEFLRSQPTDLSHHEREQGVRGDIERNSEEEIGTPLVELTTEFSITDIELNKSMAGCQSHLFDLARIPSGDDVAAAVGILFESLNKLCDLIDSASSGTLWPAPASPLSTIDGAEIALRIGPFIPDGDTILPEIADIGITLQKPEQLMDDGA